MIAAGMDLGNLGACERVLIKTRQKLSEKRKLDFTSFWDADRCPEKYLIFLAWSLGVPVWSRDWGESEKRQMIRKMLWIRRIRGTVGALRELLFSVGVICRVREGWESESWQPEELSEERMPYFFRVEIYVSENDWLHNNSRVDIIRGLIDWVKPFIAEYDIRIIVSFSQETGVAGLMGAFKMVRIESDIRRNL